MEIRLLLIDDQEIIARQIAEMLQEDHSIIFHYCPDPLNALKMIEEVRPTLILQDLVMPQIDGITLIRYFRVHPQTKQVPIIVLSSREEGGTKAEAFAAGAHDYVVKLPDSVEFLARIRHHSMGYIHLLEKKRAYSALKESQYHLLQELRQAADYVTSLLPPPICQRSLAIDWKFTPSEALGGDIFGYHWIDAEHLAIYLLDVCGHGIGSALLSVSMCNLLASQSIVQANFLDPADILTRLNLLFSEKNTQQLFFTIWYGVYSRSEHALTYASGGHPPALLFSGKNCQDAFSQPPHHLRTEGCAILGAPSLLFANERISLTEENFLYIYSDGAFEIEEKQLGKMMRFEKFVDYVSEARELDAITCKLQECQERETFEDDLSLLRLHIFSPLEGK